MMDITTHYENANFLRELAETLANFHPETYKPEQVKLLQRLANSHGRGHPG